MTGFLWGCVSREIWERFERVIFFSPTGTLSEVKASNEMLISLETKSAALSSQRRALSVKTFTVCCTVCHELDIGRNTLD